MKKITFFIAIFTSFFLVACGQPDMKGIILQVNEENILFSEGMNQTEYEKIKGSAWDELMEENIPLIDLTYKESESFQEGDHVEVWIAGEILLSHPGQARAKKIEFTGE